MVWRQAKASKIIILGVVIMSIQVNVSDLFFNFEKMNGESEDGLLITAKEFLGMLEPICNVDLPDAEELVADYLKRL